MAVMLSVGAAWTGTDVLAAIGLFVVACGVLFAVAVFVDIVVSLVLWGIR